MSYTYDVFEVENLYDNNTSYLVCPVLGCIYCWSLESGTNNSLRDLIEISTRHLEEKHRDV